jgi:hypothetical protein
MSLAIARTSATWRCGINAIRYPSCIPRIGDGPEKSRPQAAWIIP